MQYRILGPLEIFDDGDSVEVRGDVQRTLLAVLLLNANRVVAQDRLIHDLWGGNAPASGAAALQMRVSRLRKSLERPGKKNPVITRLPGYVLEVHDGELDLRAFERLLQDAEASIEQQDAAAASATLRAALDLWRGPPLAEFAYSDFARPAIIRLEELRLTAHERRIDADLALGRHTQLVSELQGLVIEHSVHEHFRSQLILALFRSGRQPDALAAYQDARTALVEQFGIEPSATLQELERRVLRQDPTLSHQPSPGDGSKESGQARCAILVVTDGAPGMARLIEVAAALTRDRQRELIIAALIEPQQDAARVASDLHARREELLAQGMEVRVASFTSRDVGADAVRLAVEQPVDLMLVEASEDLINSGEPSPELTQMLVDAPCDVGIVATRGQLTLDAEHPLLVPFGGAEHDWAAVELAAWLAKANDVPLRLVGAEAADKVATRDPTRLLARASLVLQATSGVPAEPHVLARGSDAFLEAASDAGLVVAGLSATRSGGELGAIRHALVRDSPAPVVLVQKGLRPSGIAPKETITRFTWSVSGANAPGALTRC